MHGITAARRHAHVEQEWWRDIWHGCFCAVGAARTDLGTGMISFFYVPLFPSISTLFSNFFLLFVLSTEDSSTRSIRIPSQPF